MFTLKRRPPLRIRSGVLRSFVRLVISCCSVAVLLYYVLHVTYTLNVKFWYVSGGTVSKVREFYLQLICIVITL